MEPTPVSVSPIFHALRTHAGDGSRSHAVFHLPEIAALRPGLLAEFPVYAAQAIDGVETATAGIADALTLTAEGRPAVVVDWISDVTPAPGTLDHYRSQVRAYLDVTSAGAG